MAVNPNTDFSSGAVLTAAQQNRFPRGIVAEASTTSAYNLTGTLADVPGMTVTFTAAADRLYRATLICLVGMNASEGTARGQTRLYYGATEFARAYSGALTYGYPITIAGLFVPGAGSVTVKASTYRDAGAAAIDLYADANAPMRFIVEDLGPY